MKLKTIEAHNLRGRSFREELAPVTVFTGKNRVGKTSRLHAVTLALIGHLPKLSTLVSSTFSLAGEGNTMTVAADTDIGRIERSWERQKSRIKATENLPPGMPVIPPVLLDANEYFGLSTEKRNQYVFGQMRLADAPGMSPAALIADLKQIKVEDHTAAHEQALQHIVALISDNAQTRHTLVHSGETMPMQEWLDQQLSTLDEQISNAKGSADRLAKKLAADTELQAQTATTAPLNTDAQEAEIARLREEVAKLQRQKGEITAQKSAYDRDANKVAVARAALASLVEREPMRDALAASITAGDESVAAYKSPTQQLVKDEFTAITDERALLSEMTTVTQRRIQNQSLNTGICPTCKRPHVSDEMKASAAKAVEEANIALVEGNSRLVTLRSRLKEIQQALSESRQRDIVIEERKVILAQQKATLQSLDADIARKAEFEQLIAHNPESRDFHAEIKDIDDHVLAHGRTIKDAEAVVLRSAAAKNEEARRRQAIDEAAKAQAEYVIAKLARDCVKTFRDKLIAFAFGGILTFVNSIVTPVLGITIVLKDCELGYWAGSKWVSDDLFSESESALMFAAMSVALAADSPCKIVMVDELGRIEEENRRRFLLLMSELVKTGIITQFIGAVPLVVVEGSDAGAWVDPHYPDIRFSVVS